MLAGRTGLDSTPATQLALHVRLQFGRDLTGSRSCDDDWHPFFGVRYIQFAERLNDFLDQQAPPPLPGNPPQGPFTVRPTDEEPVRYRKQLDGFSGRHVARGLVRQPTIHDRRLCQRWRVLQQDQVLQRDGHVHDATDCRQYIDRGHQRSAHRHRRIRQQRRVGPVGDFVRGGSIAFWRVPAEQMLGAARRLPDAVDR